MSKTYSGAGTLIVGDERHACEYRLENYASGSMNTGHGAVSAEGSALWKAFRENRARVEMDDGRSFPIIVNGQFSGRTADFLLAGAITDPD